MKEGRGDMSDGLKSAWEIAMEKAKKMTGEEDVNLSPDQKNAIAEIRKIYSAKIAEIEIIVQDKEKREIDLDRLRRERDRKIQAIHKKSKE
jgi:hypothetical protein